MKIEIVEDIKDKMKNDNEYVHKVLKEDSPSYKGEKSIIVTPSVFSKIFSPKRISLMLKIKKEEYGSIYKLAKAVNRKYEAVYRDIKLLEGFGIIKIKTKDKSKIPYIDEGIGMVLI